MTRHFTISPIRGDGKRRALPVQSIGRKSIFHSGRHAASRTILRTEDRSRSTYHLDDVSAIVWLTLLMLALGGLAYYLFVRYKDNKPIIKKIKIEPKLPPHQQALKEIERIKETKPCVQPIRRPIIPS